jgi:L-fuconolactonase
VSGSVRIDAHQHFWDVESGRYAWPTPADGPIYRTFGPADLEPQIRAAGIDATVLVQTVDTLEDTDSMLARADRYPFIGAVVGWVPLRGARAAEAALDAREHPKLRGIRHLVHHEPDPDWLLREDVAEGLEVLARRGFTFDVVAVFPNHLRLVPALADRHPELAIVIDHLAKPPYRAPGWSAWRDELRLAAERPNVAAKLSGLDTAAGDGWTPSELRPAVDEALDAFGPDRLLFGSDWPVCTLVSTYGEVVREYEALVATLIPAERAAVLGGTAERLYRVRVAGTGGT